jgi:hypothetical protein
MVQVPPRISWLFRHFTGWNPLHRFRAQPKAALLLVLVLVIDRNGHRDESRAEDQTGANCFELIRMAMNNKNITELESAQALPSEHEYEHRFTEHKHDANESLDETFDL